MGENSKCEPPSFFFDESATLITSENDPAMTIKVKRALPLGSTQTEMTKIRVQVMPSRTTAENNDFTWIDEIVTFNSGSSASHVNTVSFDAIPDGLWEDSEMVWLNLTVVDGPGTTVYPDEIAINIMENEESEFRFHASTQSPNSPTIDASMTQIDLTIERLTSFNRISNVGLRFDDVASDVTDEHVSFPATVKFDINERTKSFTLVCEECLKADLAGSARGSASVTLGLHDAFEEDYEVVSPDMATVIVAPRSARPTSAPTASPTFKPTEDTRNVAQKYVGGEEDQVTLPVLLGVFAGLLLLALTVAAIAIVVLTLLVARKKRTKLKNETALELDMAHLNVGMVESHGIAKGMAHTEVPTGRGEIPGMVGAGFMSNPMQHKPME
jgi:hypothetical protein